MQVLRQVLSASRTRFIDSATPVHHNWREYKTRVTGPITRANFAIALHQLSRPARENDIENDIKYDKRQAISHRGTSCTTTRQATVVSHWGKRCGVGTNSLTRGTLRISEFIQTGDSQVMDESAIRTLELVTPIDRE